jgi:thiol-disulfide isomerase/thioredoxin
MPPISRVGRGARFVLALLLVLAPWILYGRGAARSYPAGADVAVLTRDGSSVGPLERLRVPGKFTVFDVYADWCAPCLEIDRHLRLIAGSRKDVAIRKLNVVTFESPLAHELGPDFDALPYVVIYSPEGRRTVVVGLERDELEEALRTR